MRFISWEFLVDKGKIIFFNPDGSILKTWYFKDGSIVKYKEIFDPNGMGLMVEMVISAAIQDYGYGLVKPWHVSLIKKEGYRSPIYVAEDTKEEQKILRKYQIDEAGYISLCNGKEENVGDYDILMNQKGEEIKVNDTKILPMLEKITSVSKAEVSETSKYELAKVFLFAVNNSRPEWRFIRTTKNKYILATQFKEERSPSNQMLGLDNEDVFADIHSHPTSEREYSMTDEKETMGYYLGKHPLIPYRGAYNDWQIYHDAVDRGEKVPKKYVYMKGSGRLWKITYKGPDPLFIRTINNDYKRFFFGIF